MRAITVQKTAIIPEMKGKKAFEKKLSGQSTTSNAYIKVGDG